MFRVANRNHDIVYSGLVFLAVYILLAMIIMRPVVVFDTFWHLQMGKDLLEHGLSPWVDHYSVRHLGNDISGVPVIFQMLLYQFVSFFGEQDGFYYIRLLYITLIMLALWVYFRKIKANAYVVFVLLPLVASAISLRIIIRPEIFSYVFVVVCLVFYLNAQKKFATKEMLAICLLLLLWTNYHTSIIGYIIIFGLFLEKAINKVVHQDESIIWSHWVLWGLLIFSIGFIDLNLNGRPFIVQHFLLATINVMSQGYGQYIQEYSSTYSGHSTNVLTHVSWVLSAYVVVWSVVKKQYGFAFVVALMTYFSWSTVRLLSVVLLINMCVLALYWTQFLSSSHFLNLRGSIKKALFIVSVCVSLMTLYFLAEKAQRGVALGELRQAFLERRYPAQVVDYLARYQNGGNILNALEYGGYLLYKLSPDYKIYYDGRSNILYPIEFVKHNAGLWDRADRIEDVVEQYDIRYVVRKNTPGTYALLNGAKNLKLSFADDHFLLFSRAGKAEFPLASTLLAFPHCWQNVSFQADFSSDDISPGIKSEIERAEKLFSSQQYTLEITLEFIKSYLAAEDKKAFFRTLSFEPKHTDAVRRIALYMAMEYADKSTVSDLFASIGLKNDYDMLLYSYYLANNGDYEDAEKLAYYFYRLEKQREVRASYDKFGILNRILGVLKKNTQLQKFELSYADKLEANWNKLKPPFDRELSFDFMCK